MSKRSRNAKILKILKKRKNEPETNSFFNVKDLSKHSASTLESLMSGELVKWNDTSIFERPIRVSSRASLSRLSVKKEKLDVSMLKEYSEFYQRKCNDYRHETNTIVPKHVLETFRFTLTGVDVAFANALRIMFLGNIETICLTVDDSDIKSSSAYFLHDFFKLNLEALRVSEDLLRFKDSHKIFVSVYSASPMRQKFEITSKDIQIECKTTGKTIDTSALFEQNIVLFGDTSFVLNPNTRAYTGRKMLLFRQCLAGLQIMQMDANKIQPEHNYFSNNKFLCTNKVVDKLDLGVYEQATLTSFTPQNFGLNHLESAQVLNISIERGTARQNGNKFATCSDIYYCPLDAKGQIPKTTLKADYKIFHMGFKTYGNYSSKEILLRGCLALFRKYQRIWHSFVYGDGQPATTVPFVSSLLEITNVEEGMIQYQFNNNRWIFSTLISKYVLNKHGKNVEFVAPLIKHLDSNKAIVKIKARNHLQYVKEAILDICADILAIGMQANAKM